MTIVSKNGTERDIASWLRRDASIRGVIERVVRALPSATRILLIGGALRDHLLRPGASLKDVDLVVDGVSSDVLAQQLRPAHRNFYGGLNLEFDGQKVDVWPLAETYHIREFHLDATVDNLLAGAPFNLDKIAFDVARDRLFEEGFLAGLRAKEIVYAPLNPYLEPIQAARCVLLRDKTGFSLAESARALLRRAAQSMRQSDERTIEVHEFLRSAYGIGERAARRQVIDEIATSELTNPATSVAG